MNWGVAPAPGGGPVDPIFSGEERVDPSPRRSTLLFQFFLFPLLIVLAAVLVFVFFGAIGGSEKPPLEQLKDVRTGGTNVQKQAMQQLAVSLRDERRRVDEGKIKAGEAFYADSRFKDELLAAFEESFEDRRGVERQQALAVSIGAVGDPGFVRALQQRLAPEVAPEVRQAVAHALGSVTSDEAVPALVGASKDPDEVVRNFAVAGLARHDVPASREALRAALADPSPFVRLSAGSALAVLGDADGKDAVRKQLDPAWVQENVVDAPAEEGGAGSEGRTAVRQAALANGLRGALALRDEELRPLVQALEKDRDPEVRRLARDVLDRWPPPK